MLVKYLAPEAFARTEFEAYQDGRARYPVDARLSPASMEVYACGINAMVYSLVDAVGRLGVPDERTRFEGSASEAGADSLGAAVS